MTRLVHALQYATLAEHEQESPAMIVAPLLHDVGYMLHGDVDEIMASRGINAGHVAKLFIAGSNQ